MNKEKRLSYCLLILYLCMLWTMSGCSLWNPHVRWERPDPHQLPSNIFDDSQIRTMTGKIILHLDEPPFYLANRIIKGKESFQDLNNNNHMPKELIINSLKAHISLLNLKSDDIIWDKLLIKSPNNNRTQIEIPISPAPNKATHITDSVINKFIIGAFPPLKTPEPTLDRGKNATLEIRIPIKSNILAESLRTQEDNQRDSQKAVQNAIANLGNNDANGLSAQLDFSSTKVTAEDNLTLIQIPIRNEDITEDDINSKKQTIAELINEPFSSIDKDDIQLNKYNNLRIEVIIQLPKGTIEGGIDKSINQTLIKSIKHNIKNLKKEDNSDNNNININIQSKEHDSGKATKIILSDGVAIDKLYDDYEEKLKQWIISSLNIKNDPVVNHDMIKYNDSHYIKLIFGISTTRLYAHLNPQFFESDKKWSPLHCENTVKQALETTLKEINSGTKLSNKINWDGVTVTPTNTNESEIHLPLKDQEEATLKDEQVVNEWMQKAFPDHKSLTVEYDTTPTQNDIKTRNPTTLDEGLIYAQNAIEAYKDGIRDQTILTNVMATTLIPLSAAALGMGIAEANGTSLAALGLSGAAVYGTGTFLSSKPRQLVYAEGIKAVSCAVNAMLPLKYPLNDYYDFQRDLSELQSQMEIVKERINGLRNQIEKEEPTPDIINVAQTALVEAAEVETAGLNLKRELQNANNQLINSIDLIAAEIDKAIIQTVPDTQAITQIIQGLGQISGNITSRPDIFKPEKPAGAITQKKPVADKKYEFIADLEDSLSKLRIYMKRINGVVNYVAEKKPVETLKQCNVNITSLGITIIPKGPIRIGQSQTKGLIITGGQAPYIADLLDPTDGLDVTQTSPFGPKVEITTKKDVHVKGGKYNLYLSDSAGHDTKITIMVEKAKEDTPARTDKSKTELKNKMKSVATSAINELINIPQASINTSSMPGKTIIRIPALQEIDLTLDNNNTTLENWINEIFKNNVESKKITSDNIEIISKLPINDLIEYLKET